MTADTCNYEEPQYKSISELIPGSVGMTWAEVQEREWRHVLGMKTPPVGTPAIIAPLSAPKPVRPRHKILKSPPKPLFPNIEPPEPIRLRHGILKPDPKSLVSDPELPMQDMFYEMHRNHFIPKVFENQHPSIEVTYESAMASPDLDTEKKSKKVTFAEADDIMIIPPRQKKRHHRHKPMSPRPTLSAKAKAFVP